MALPPLFRRVAICVAASCLASLPAAADEVRFAGPLTIKAVDEFIRLNDDKPVTQLSISSLGGILDAGIKLGRWVQRKHADVRVNFFCASACANYVFAAGRHKIITPGSVVMWHGGAQAWEFTEALDEYRRQVALAMRPDPDPYAKFAVATLKRYSTVADVRDLETAYFKEVGFDGALVLLGSQPVHYDTEWWTATVGVMERYGLKDVEAPVDYGTPAYLNKSLFRRMYFKDARVTFELGPDGAVVATPVGN
jgi:ATP-dependent protease ClpP protease subunit